MRRLATTLSGLGFVWACVATARALLGAAYQSATTSSTVDLGAAGPVVSTSTLVDVNGAWVVGLLGAVTLIAGVPLFVALRVPWAQRAATWTTAVLLLAFSIISGFSVGMAFLPTAGLLLASAVATLFMRAPGAPVQVGQRGAI